MRNPISPLAIIAVPTIEAGYRERDHVIEAVTCGVVVITELRGCAETLCKGLSLDRLGPLSVVGAMQTSGTAFDPGSSAVFLASDFEPFADLASPRQLDSDILEWCRNALIFVAMVSEGAAMRMSHMPVTSFPMSIKIVKTMPRQTTAEVNMRVTGIENPIEAYTHSQRLNSNQWVSSALTKKNGFRILATGCSRYFL